MVNEKQPLTDGASVVVALEGELVVRTLRRIDDTPMLFDAAGQHCQDARNVKVLGVVVNMVRQVG